jgi:hypothetical protein
LEHHRGQATRAFTSPRARVRELAPRRVRRTGGGSTDEWRARSGRLSAASPFDRPYNASIIGTPSTGLAWSTAANRHHSSRTLSGSQASSLAKPSTNAVRDRATHWRKVRGADPRMSASGPTGTLFEPDPSTRPSDRRLTRWWRASTRRRHGEPQRPSGARHPVVIGHHSSQVGPKRQGGGQVDGIERSDVLGKQGTCGGQDFVAHSREVESAEDVPASSDGIGTEREKCSCHLGSRESTGDERTTAS